MSLCQNFRHLINALVTILILSVGGLAQAQLDEALSRRNVASSQADYEAVNQLLSQFALATPQQQSSIVVQLAQYKYDDVARALIKILDFQFKSNNTNTFIVNAAIDALNSMADSSYSPEIQLVIQQINQARYTDQKLSNDKTFTAISNKLNALATTASNNQQALPRLQVPTQTATQNNINLKADTKNQNPDFSVPLQEKVMSLAKQMGPMLPPELTAFLSVRPDYLTDEALEDRAKNDSYEIIGREKESNEVIDTLVRSKGKNPVLVGPRGAGKTSIATKIADMIIDESFPQSEAHINDLKGAFVISTTPGKISMLAKSDSDGSQGAAMEQYLDAIKWVEDKLNTKLILFIDEIHTLSKGQIEAMKPYLDSKKKAIRLIGASTSVEMQNAFKNNPAFLRRLQQIGVAEQSFSEVLKIVQLTKIPSVKKKYNVAINADALEVIVKSSASVYPDKSQVDAAVTIVEDLAIAQIRKNPVQQKTGFQVNEDMAYAFIQSKLKFPVNPLDAKAIRAYGTDLEKHLAEIVIGQDRMISEVTNEWTKLLMSSGQKGVRTVALLGPTGTGKSLLGRELAKKVFGTEGAFLEIDANNFKNGGMDLNTLFGAPNGVISSNETSGQLYDYIDDPGRGKGGGIILINEGERAHPEFWERWMEIMDTGRGTGGDGKERRLSKHLIIITSNRGDKIVYPPQVENWSDKEIADQMHRYNSEELKKLFTQKTSGKDNFTLPDPILARIDKFSLAAPVTKNLARRIAQSKIVRIVQELSEKFKIKIMVAADVAKSITDSSYTPGMGTRPVEKAVDRVMNDTVVSALAEIGMSKNDLLNIDVEAQGQNHAIRGTANGKIVHHRLPKLTPDDKMEDPAFLNRLKNLKQNVSKRVIGQDDAIQRLADAVIAHEANAANAERPQSFFLVGSTGTGKTEFAKALAEALYDKSERVSIIPVGHVRFDGHLNDIFGSSKGFVGSTDTALFEHALINNPDGGIIVFDEASNMGGDEKSKKSELFKSFYDILDEGKWTSRSTNKTYDLKKYKFIFTGNDGEKITMGLSSDDMKMTAWKRNKEPAQVRALLLKAGVPQALLGRMSETILYKPLLKDEVKQISDKLVQGALKSYINDGLKFEFSNDFYGKMADAFFTSDMGARSIRNVADKQISTLVAKAIIAAGGKSKLRDHTLRFSISDNRDEKTYATSETPEREVVVYMEVVDKNNNVSLRLVLPATDYANKELKLSKRNALATSYHEAGHAVVNNPKVTGQKLSYITIRGGMLSDGTQYLGYARYDELNSGIYSAQANENMIIQKAAQLLAGQLAQQLAGYGADAGWSNDLEKTRSMISEYLLKWGLIKELQAVRVNKSGEPILNAKQTKALDENMDRIFNAAEALAKEQLTKNWNFVRALVGELIARGSVDENRFKQIEVGYAKTRVNILDKVKDRILPSSKGSTKMCRDIFR
jgi:ATP-dependent Clp protease ATP-binding subunit ClpC